MKKTILLLSLLAFTSVYTQCVQLKKIKKMKILNKELVFPNITSENELMEFSQLQKKKVMEKASRELKTSSESGTRLKDYDNENNCLTEYYFNKDEGIFQEVVHQKIDPNGTGELENSIHFIQGKTYFPKGKLKDKWLYFQGGTGEITILKKFEYNEKGALINEFDVSKYYKYSLIDIFKILEKNNLKIDFNKADSMQGGIGPLSIKPLDTNHGKIWFVNALVDGFQVVIYDGAEGVMIKELNQISKIPFLFLVMDKQSFDDNYKGMPIEEVERETNIKLFVYETV